MTSPARLAIVADAVIFALAAGLSTNVRRMIGIGSQTAPAGGWPMRPQTEARKRRIAEPLPIEAVIVCANIMPTICGRSHSA
jgi:hypothetical protein